ncbi:hypothetical protein PT447_00120 [Aliarcobacter butzleri]|uniref:hypothetical protein n=1 Tax=Aliarcobacter butzleri TaxID=28197 RepID=UPI0024DEFDBF|nr:hypothetical protein [Aliarcobacter butzleri]MDK2063324.1 hypothetical protein [Aliarcobacter butzleri]
METIGKVVLTTVLLSYIVWRILIILEGEQIVEVEEPLKLNKITIIGDKCDDGNQFTLIDLYVDTKGTCKGM